MRVAILNLTGGGISGGHRKYLLNILPLLAAYPELEALLCASPASLKATGWLPKIQKVSYAECEQFRPFRHTPGPQLMAALDSFAPDLIYIPLERYVRYRDLPVVIMLQNMAPLAGAPAGSGVKEFFTAAARRYETRYALRRASAVIAPTEFARDFLVVREKLPPSRVTAVPYGASGKMAPREPASVPGKKFVFTAGSLEPYRGLEDLIRAFSLMLYEEPDLLLIIAGGARPGTKSYEAKMKALVSTFGLDKSVRWLGHVEECELAWYYANCSVMAITSSMESFCFVALEAMEQGCRIVASDAACLPEVIGTAGIYYRHGNPGELASKLTVQLRSVAAPGRVLERAARFSWSGTAEATMQILRKAVKNE